MDYDKSFLVGESNGPLSLFHLSVEYLGKNFDTLLAESWFYDKISLGNYTFPSNVADALVKSIVRWEKIDYVKVLQILAQPQIFPLTKIGIKSGHPNHLIDSTQALCKAILNFVEAQGGAHLRSLTLSSLNHVTFEALIAHFFVPDPGHRSYNQLIHLELSDNGDPSTLAAIVQADTRIDFFTSRTRPLDSSTPQIGHAPYPSPPQVLSSLKCLDLSSCHLLTSELLAAAILPNLPALQWLDISLTNVKDLTALGEAPCSTTLKHLGLHGLQISCSDTAPPVLTKLKGLVSLDISEPAGKHFRLYQARTPVHLILSSRTLPRLKAIDLSGVAGLSPLSLVTLIELHPDLQFLGLMLCHACYDPRLNEILDANPAITVAGEANEKQLFYSLLAYGSRPGYLQKGLQRLFSFTRDTSQVNVDVVKLILHTLDSYPAHLGINLAGTACLYNIVKIKNMETYLGLSLAKRLVNTSLNAMENFFSNQQLQKNVIILLCNDWIINNVNFDRLRCTRLVLNCLCVYKDQRMIQMCAAITSLIAAKMSIAEVNELGSKSSYVKRLLEIIGERVHNVQNDAILKLCLSAIWNLTDESPRTCENFIHENGISVYFQAFNAFQGDAGVITKFLGSLSNIAEVRRLRRYLLTPAYLAQLRTLTGSVHVPVSYFAAGICAQLVSTGPLAWERSNFGSDPTPPSERELRSRDSTPLRALDLELSSLHPERGAMPSREDVSRELADKVLSWQEPENELVSYRSFKPFFRLLQRPFDEIGVHLWALWALCHVTSKNPKRYMELIRRENGKTLLIGYRQSVSYANEPSVRPFVDKLLELISLHDQP